MQYLHIFSFSDADKGHDNARDVIYEMIKVEFRERNVYTRRASRSEENGKIFFGLYILYILFKIREIADDYKFSSESGFLRRTSLLQDARQHHVQNLIESRYSKVVCVCEILRLSSRGPPPNIVFSLCKYALVPDCTPTLFPGPSWKIEFGTPVAFLLRHFTSGSPNKRFPQVASRRLYYARHTRGTPQPLSGRELPIFLAITRACKPELAEYVRRFLTRTSPFYAVEARGEQR